MMQCKDLFSLQKYYKIRARNVKRIARGKDRTIPQSLR
jgi:hypothetical protein